MPWGCLELRVILVDLGCKDRLDRRVRAVVDRPGILEFRAKRGALVLTGKLERRASKACKEIRATRVSWDRQGRLGWQEQLDLLELRVFLDRQGLHPLVKRGALDRLAALEVPERRDLVDRLGQTAYLDSLVCVE